MTFRDILSKLRGRGESSTPDSYRSRFSPDLFVDRLEERRVLVAPVVLLPGLTVQYTENDPATAIDTTATVTDADSADFDTGNLTVSITANGTANDRLSILSGVNNITVVGNSVRYDFGGGAMEIGTVAGNDTAGPLVVTLNAMANDVATQALVQNVAYHNVSENPSTADRTVEFTLNDGDGETSTPATETVEVTASADDPVITLTGGTVTYNENDPATIIDGGATLADADSTDFDTGVLTISFSANGTVNDQLAIRNQGTSNGEISVSGNVISYNPISGPLVTIGTFAGGTNGTDLVITLDADADDEAVEALMRNITYQNTSDNPSTLTRTVQFQMTDGDGGTSAGATRDIDVVASNDDPVITLTGGNVIYDENDSATVIDSGASLNDPDSVDFDTGVLTISFTANGTVNDQLAIRNQGTAIGQISVSGSMVLYNFGAGAIQIGTFAGGTNGSNLVITLNGISNDASVEALMQNITYQNTSENPSALTRTVQFQMTDGDGGTSAGSTRGIQVNASNDDPVITLTGGNVTYTENDPATIIDSGATLADPDSANFDTGVLTISFTANGTANDQLAIRNQGTAIGQISVSGSMVLYNFGAGAIQIGTFAGGTNGTNLVITLNASSDDASVEALMQNITYQNTSENPSVLTRTVQFQMTDGDGGTSAGATRGIQVTTVNDDPVITLTGGNVTYNENDPATIIDSGATLADPDSADFDTGVLTISFTANGTVNDQLAINNEGTGVGQISVSGTMVLYNFGAGAIQIGTFAGGVNGANLVITLNSSSDDASVEALMQNITYQNTSDNPSALTRTVQFQMTDGDGGTSAGATRDIQVNAVNDDPVITLTGGNVTYNENDPATVIDSGATLADPDSADFDTGVLTISFTANGTVNDQLAIRNQGTAIGQISVSGSMVLYNFGGGAIQIGTFAGGVNGANLVITLNASSDDASVEALMQNITYENTSDDPSTLTRTVQYQMTDGDGGTSNGDTRDIDVIAANDDPVITLTGGNVMYDENDPPTIIDGGATLFDPDSPDFDTGVLNISFTANGTVNDQLAVRNQGTGNGQISVAGNVISYNPLIGPTVTIGTFAGGTNGSNLVITLNANADDEAIEALMQNITYENTSNNPSTLTRTVQFQITDGDGGTSAGATRNIEVNSVNDPPTLTTTGGTTPYTENDPATIIDSGVTLADPDSTDFDTGVLTVSFSANGTVNDQLEIRNQGILIGQISVAGNQVFYNFGAVPVLIGTFAGGTNGADLVITLNANSNDPSVEALMQNITYRNTSDDPSPLDRTVQFELTDGDGGTSNGAVKVIDFTVVNDPPTLAVNNTAMLNEGDNVTITNLLLRTDDPDDGADELTYTIVAMSVTNGTLLLNGVTPLNVGDMFTQDDIDNGRISYQHDGSETTTDSFMFSVADGGEDGATPIAGTFNFQIAPVNDPPTLVVPGTQIVNEDVLTMLGTITVGDVEADAVPTNIQVTLMVNNGTLTLTDQTGLIVLNNGTGTVTATGTSAALNAVLDNNLFYQTNLNFDQDDTLTVTVSDLGVSGSGGTQTTQQTVTIDVQPVNDAPVSANVSAAFDQNTGGNFALNVTDVDTSDNPVGANFTYTQASVAVVDAAGIAAGATGAGILTNNGDGTFTFAPNGQFTGLRQGAQAIVTFTYTATDPGGLTSNASTVTITVTGLNDTPIIQSILAGSSSTNEGDAATLIVSYNGIDVGDTHTVTIQWGDGSTQTLTTGGSPFATTHVYIDDPVGFADPPYTITAFVTDDFADSSTTLAMSMPVNNLNPFFFNADASDVTAIGETTVSGFLMDNGVADTHTLQIDWGDGAVDTLTFNSTGGMQFFSATHIFVGNPNPTNPAADIPITLTAVDDDGGTFSTVVEASVPGQGLFTPNRDTSAVIQVIENIVPPAVEIVTNDAAPVEQQFTSEIQTTRSGVTSSQYERLVLRRVRPDGTEGEDVPLHEDDQDSQAALKNLKTTLSNLPPDHYRIYLIREDGTERLVLDIVLKRQLKKQQPDETTTDGANEETPRAKPMKVRDESPVQDSRDQEPADQPANETDTSTPANQSAPQSGPTLTPPTPTGDDNQSVSPIDETADKSGVPASAALAGVLGVGSAHAWRRLRQRQERAEQKPANAPRRRRRHRQPAGD